MPERRETGQASASASWRAVIGALVRTGLAIFFRRIEHFHAERVPTTGPVLFVSNHPGSVTDALIIGTSIPRVVHFVATVKLFQLKPVAKILTKCGVVPVNRRQDDPGNMNSVALTFAHCYEVFERGGAIGIFPEGVSYSDEQLRPIKTGAARMALEVEDRNNGTLGLTIVPVGLTYAAKDRFRSDVLVHFGQPFAAAEWLARYRLDKHEAVRQLSTAIEHSIRELILDLPSLDHQRIVKSVKRLYLDKLRLSNLIVTEPTGRAAEELLLSQAIAAALAHFETHHPARLADFVIELMRYEQRLWTLGISDRSVDGGGLIRSSRAGWLRTIALIAGAPLATYGWVHRLAPVWFVDWAVDRFAMPENRRAQVAHASMIAGLVGFGALYLIAALLMWQFVGPRLAVLYVVSLPVTGFFAHWYFRTLGRYAGQFKAAVILLRAPLTRRNLERKRARLVADIDAFRADYRREVLGIQTDLAREQA